MKLTDEQLGQRNRLKAWMKLQNIKREELASRTGFKKSSINQILSGNNPVSPKLLFEISKNYTGVDIHWIETGTSTMHEPEPKKPEGAQTPPLKPKRRDQFSPIRLLVEYAQRLEAMEQEVAALRRELEALKKE